MENEKEKMEEVAGEKGIALLVPSFDILSDHLDEVLELYCGKFRLQHIISPVTDNFNVDDKRA